MAASRGKIIKPQKVVIYGPEGIGKSSLAAMFPNGIFLDVEGSTYQLDVAREDRPSSWTMLQKQVEYYKINSNEFDTLIVDTADWAETLCINNILSNNSKSSLSGFPHGQGYVILEEEFGRFLNSLSDLIELGINIVVVAHAQIDKFDQPDEMGSYNRWAMKLEKKTAPLLKEWADMVLFINYKTYVVTSDSDKRSKKAQGGSRVIFTTHHVCWDAKNRHGLPEELSFNSPEDGWKQIAHCIPIRDKSVKQPPKQEPIARDLSETIEKESKPVETPKVTENQNSSLPADIPKTLVDLMTADNVTVEEVQKAVAKRGYFPEDTPISKYPSEFVNGWLVALWPQVFKFIQENIR